MPLDTRPGFRSAADPAPAAASPTPNVQHLWLARLAEIERALAAAPDRIRHSPVRRALWRALLMPVGELFRRRRLGTMLPLHGEPGCLDGLAEVLVAKACTGDVRAVRLLFDLIEGKPRGRPEIQPSGGLDPVVIEQLVRFFQEHAAPTPAGAGR
jgi:hypothetical protein